MRGGDPAGRSFLSPSVLRTSPPCEGGERARIPSGPPKIEHFTWSDDDAETLIQVGCLPNVELNGTWIPPSGSTCDTIKYAAQWVVISSIDTVTEPSRKHDLCSLSDSLFLCGNTKLRPGDIFIFNYIRDSDNDSLEDNMEIIFGTNPHNPDSDGDGISDGYEIKLGLNPLNPNSDNSLYEASDCPEMEWHLTTDTSDIFTPDVSWPTPTEGAHYLYIHGEVNGFSPGWFKYDIWELPPLEELELTEQSKLSFNIFYHLDFPAEFGNAIIDLRLISFDDTDTSWLSEYFLPDENGEIYHPQLRVDPLNRWINVEVPMGTLPDMRKVDRIQVHFNKPSVVSPGEFHIFIDEILITI